MKRIAVVVLLVAVVAGGSFAQDISGLGRDFETLIERLGADMLPDLQQAAVWGQFPGSAALPESSRFFFTLSGGAILSDGIFTFVADPDAFEVLSIGNLVSGLLESVGSETATNLYEGIQGFFPYPVARTALGFRLPGGFEAMVDVAGFPQFITGFVGSFAEAGSLKFSTLHVGSRVRKAITTGGGPFPLISIGAGYGYSGMTLGYDLAAYGEPGAAEGFGSVDVGLGELNLKGDLLIRSTVHAFGLDLHASKAFGFFVPFIVVSPYYHLASFSGGIGDDVKEFAAFIDYDGGGDDQDIAYVGPRPQTAWVDNDLSIVLAGGFDMVFGRTVLQVHGSWSFLKGSPAVSLGVRRQ